MCGIIDSIIQKILGRLSGLLTVSTGGILGFALWLGANYLLRRQRTRTYFPVMYTSILSDDEPDARLRLGIVYLSTFCTDF
jgi:hypothetical protein